MADSLSLVRARVDSFESWFSNDRDIPDLAPSLIGPLELHIANLTDLKREWDVRKPSAHDVMRALSDDLKARNKELLCEAPDCALSKKEMQKRVDEALKDIRFVHGGVVSRSALNKIIWRALEPWEQKCIVQAQKRLEKEASDRKLAASSGAVRAAASEKKLRYGDKVDRVMSSIEGILGESVAAALMPHREALADCVSNDPDPEALLEDLEAKDFRVCLDLVAACAKKVGLWDERTMLADYGLAGKISDSLQGRAEALLDELRQDLSGPTNVLERPKPAAKNRARELRMRKLWRKENAKMNALLADFRKEPERVTLGALEKISRGLDEWEEKPYKNR